MRVAYNEWLNASDSVSIYSGIMNPFIYSYQRPYYLPIHRNIFKYTYIIHTENVSSVIFFSISRSVVLKSRATTQESEFFFPFRLRMHKSSRINFTSISEARGTVGRTEKNYRQWDTHAHLHILNTGIDSRPFHFSLAPEKSLARAVVVRETYMYIRC